MRTTRTIWRTAPAAAALLALSLMAACGGSGNANGNLNASDPWSPVRLAALEEVEGYGDVLHMRDAADLVIVGSFVGFERGREVVLPDGLGAGEDDVLVWVEGRLEIEEILHSADHMEPLEDMLADGVLSADGRVLTVEFFVGGTEALQEIDEGIAQMNADLVGTGDRSRDQRAVLFLRMNGGPGEPAPIEPESAPEVALGEPDGCRITVDDKVMAGLDDGEMFDPAKHYPGYDEAKHGACLFVLPDEDGYRPMAVRPAEGDVDDVGRLRLVWRYGLVTGTDEHPVDAPLGEHVEEEMPAGTGAGTQDEELPDPRDAWSSLEEFIDYVRTG